MADSYAYQSKAPFTPYKFQEQEEERTKKRRINREKDEKRCLGIVRDDLIPGVMDG
jgi:hypothetical protein